MTGSLGTSTEPWRLAAPYTTSSVIRSKVKVAIGLCMGFTLASVVQSSACLLDLVFQFGGWRSFCWGIFRHHSAFSNWCLRECFVIVAADCEITLANMIRFSQFFQLPSDSQGNFQCKSVKFPCHVVLCCYTTLWKLMPLIFHLLSWTVINNNFLGIFQWSDRQLVIKYH